jgi:hypothetical protein
MMRIVSHLVKHNVEIRRIEAGWFGRKHLDIRQLSQLFEQCRGIVGYSASSRRKRRKEGDLVCHG